MERELEALRLAKESFAATMEHEKSVLEEQYESKKSQMLHEFEVLKQELETEMQRKEAEIENRMREAKKSFEEERDRELGNVKYLKDVASREMEEMKLERIQLEKEKQDVFANQKHLEGQQLEMKKDIDELVSLSIKLKDQREQFLKEKKRFVAFVEENKGCKECGERVSEFVLSDLQSLSEMKNADSFPLPKFDGYLKEAGQGTSERPNVGTSMAMGNNNSGSPASGGTLTWLRKCTSKISIFSTGKKNVREGGVEDGSTEGATQAQEKLVDVGEIPEYILSSEEEQEVSARVVLDSFDVQRVQSVDDAGDDDHGNTNSQTHDIEEVSQQQSPSDMRNESQSKRTRRATTRGRGRPKRATSENNGVEHSSEVGVGVEGTSKTSKGRRKRAIEEDPDYSEYSDSVTTGSRRQKVEAQPQPQPQVRRYNLRRPKAGAPALSNQTKEDDVSVSHNSKGSGRLGRKSRAKPQPGASASLANGDHTQDSQPHHHHHHDGFLEKKVVDGENEVAGNNCSDDVGVALSEEVNGTPQQHRQHQTGTPPAAVQDQHDNDNDDDDESEDEEEEVEHPGEVSIGRKLWTFIST